MGHQDRTVEEVLGRLAFSAHGLVKRRQLLDAEITAKQIRSRIDKRMLLVEYPGVYRVGHRAPSLEATYLAAVWACGDDALLSGRAAGHLLELLRGAPSPPEVIAPTERRVGGVITHRSRVLHPTEAMKWRKVPVTSFGRTLVDLAAVLTVNELARACHEAGVKHRVTPAQVEAVLSRRLNAPGAGKLREILRGDARVRLSELESAFLSFSEKTTCRYRRPIGRLEAGEWTAAGPNTGSRSSSTATATTTAVGPGRLIAGVSGRRTRAAISFAATPGAMYSRSRGSCALSSVSS
jgi:hypothetical protein